MAKKLGECLLQSGLITEQALNIALAEHARVGERVGSVMIRMNLVTEHQIAEALALQLGLRFVNLAHITPAPEVVGLIPKYVCLARACIAIALEKNFLTVAMADPEILSIVRDLEFQTGCRIKQAAAARSEIIKAVEFIHPGDARLTRPNSGLVKRNGSAAVRGTSPAVGPEAPQGETALAGLLKQEIFELTAAGVKGGSRDSTPVVDLVNLMVRTAIKSRASDIHVEPTEKGVLIRQRLDGQLKEVMELPLWMHEALVARVKITSGMDISEKRLPQDGRLRATTDEGGAVDFRVSSLRTLFGEKVVMRMLDRSRGVPSLEDIGMETTSLELMRQFLRQQHGMILVVGPTGSGKTTTLSAGLKSVQSERTNIITIEDPIEYQIPGVNQTQVNEKIKLTFATALRSILRQDPDVILVGEIRDSETATIAMQAAQTGHLVLSTLHTDDAPSAITRLMDIGVEPYVISSALVGVVAQRLVRRLCVACRRQYSPSAETLRALNISESEAAAIPFYRPTGCDQCNHTGFRGRIGIYEVMKVTDRLRRLIAARVPETEIREAARHLGMLSLGEDGVSKVKAGVTTPEELLRVVAEVNETKTLCTGCGGAVASDFLRCPHCGKGRSGACTQCGRGLHAEWKFCPYCVKTGERARKTLRPAVASPRWGDLPSAANANVAEFKR